MVVLFVVTCCIFGSILQFIGSFWQCHVLSLVVLYINLQYIASILCSLLCSSCFNFASQCFYVSLCIILCIIYVVFLGILLVVLAFPQFLLVLYCNQVVLCIMLVVCCSILVGLMIVVVHFIQLVFSCCMMQSFCSISCSYRQQFIYCAVAFQVLCQYYGSTLVSTCFQVVFGQYLVVLLQQSWHFRQYVGSICNILGSF